MLLTYILTIYNGATRDVVSVSLMSTKMIYPQWLLKGPVVYVNYILITLYIGFTIIT